MSTKETTAGHDVKPTARPWVHHSGSVWASKPVIDGFASVPIAKMDREYGNGTTPCERDANAALIVRAVNAHDELVSALRATVNALEDIRQMAEARQTCIRMSNGTMLGNFCRMALRDSDAASTKAEGREVAV